MTGTIRAQGEQAVAQRLMETDILVVTLNSQHYRNLPADAADAQQVFDKTDQLLCCPMAAAAAAASDDGQRIRGKQSTLNWKKKNENGMFGNANHWLAWNQLNDRFTGRSEPPEPRFSKVSSFHR